MPKKPTQIDREAVIQEQAAEIERLRAEVEGLKTGSERLYVLPHPTRRGVGDLWRGYEEGRERPDNVVMAPEAVGRVRTPSEQEIVEALAARQVSAGTKKSGAEVASEVLEDLETGQE